jgi:hypothetical protein
MFYEFIVHSNVLYSSIILLQNKNGSLNFQSEFITISNMSAYLIKVGQFKQMHAFA